MTTKYFQVFTLDRPERAVRSYRTEDEAVKFCEEGFGADYMSTYDLSIRTCWTNREGKDLERFLRSGS